MARAAFDSDAKLGMPVLNEYNFMHWKQRLIACLDYKHILEALKPQPTGSSEEDLAKISAWKRMNSEARHIILSGLRDEQLSLINSTDDASQILRDIERVYGESSINSFRNLVCKLTRLRMNSKEEFTEHINKFTEIIQRIDLTPKAFDEDTKIAFLLSSLGPRFGAFVSLMEHRQGLTFKDLIGYLKEECRDRGESPVRNARSKDSSYASRQCTKSKEMPKKVICFNCNKEGHIAKNCRAPKAKKPHPFQPKGEKKGKCECTWLLQERNLAVQNRENKRNKWILDSGASSHFSYKKDYFNEINEINDEEGSEIEIADGNIVKAKGAGSMSLKCSINNECIENTISRVLYVPELSCNLISVSTLDKKGFQVTFGNGECKVTRNGKVFAQAKLINGVYELDLSENQSAKVAHSSQKDEADLDLWHRRLGHKDASLILDLQKRNLVRGLQVKQSNKAPAKCISCITEKAVKPSFPRCAEQRSNKVLDIVHTDICGPMNVPSLGKNRYILIFLDDFSRFCVVYFLKEKSETVDKLQEYIAMVKNKFQRAPAVLMSDNGGEYCSNEVQTLLAREGIAHVTTIPYTPQQNAIAERKFRSIMDMTRCMLKDARLPHKLWAEGVYTSVYLQNRLPTKGAERTPFELWHGKAPNLSHIRVFGSPCYFHVPKEHRHKLDSRAKAGILVGYASGGKGYRIMDLQTGKTNAYHAVYFDEYGKVDTKNTVVDSSDESERTQEFVYFPFETPQSNYLPSSVTAPPTGDAPEDAEDQNPGGTRDEDEDSDGDMPALEEDEEADAVAEPEVRRSSRTNRGVPPVRLSYLAGSAFPQEPSTWEEIQEMPAAEASLWRKAAQEEMDALHQNKTWTLTELPPGKKAIGSKWVFKVKKGSEGEVQRYKARLVAQGFSQRFGEDYDEVFAPTVRYSSVRMLLSIAASKKMRVKHIDIATAFLHGQISEEIYMKQPKGFVKPHEAHLVCKLQKGLYGLKQAARAWNQKLHKMLTQLGYKQGDADKCLYSKSNNGQFSYILAFVDDLIIATASEKDYTQIVKHLSKEVEVKELGDVQYYLGIQVEREEDGSFLLSQRQKIHELVEHMQMQDAHPVATPMATDFLKNQQDSKQLPDNNDYRSAIGKLLYLVTTCRPDLANAVGILSRKVNSPTEHDWAGVKRVVRYLKGTMNCKLRLPAVKDPKLVGYTDADWAGDNADYKSTSGHVFMFGDGPVAWGSYKQSCVALSSTESEYVAATEACREIAWLDQLIKDFGLVRKGPVSLLEDNQSCLKLTQSEKFLARTKHIGVKYHYIRQMIQDGLVELSYCSTQEMTADILTKPLPRESFQNLRVKLGLWVVE